MKLICDPSSGWRYNFPREVPERFTNNTGRVLEEHWEEFRQWVIDECEGNDFYTIRFWNEEDK